MGNVRFLAGEKIVQGNHVMSGLDQPFAQVRTEKPGAAGNQDAFNGRHERALLDVVGMDSEYTRATAWRTPLATLTQGKNAAGGRPPVPCSEHCLAAAGSVLERSYLIRGRLRA